MAALLRPFGPLALRLLCAVLIGAALGWTRERREKPAGLRTHMLVALGSCLFVVLALGVKQEWHDGVDPTRVIQGIVAGVGFLGAAAIIRGNGSVRGVTTAASVWTAGALGAACGLAAFRLAILGGVLAFLILWLVEKLEER